MPHRTHSRLTPEQTEHMLQDVSGAIMAVDRDWRCVYINARASSLFGYLPADMIGQSIWTEFPENTAPAFTQAFRRAMSGQVTIEFEARHPRTDRWLECHIHPSEEGLALYFRDISARKRSEALVRGQNRILEMAALGADLPQTLDTLLRTLEGFSEDLLCSVLLLEPDGVHVRHGAGPSLPADFVKAIDGSPIGPSAGSCGTAMHRGKAVFVADIATDPLWADYKELALRHGLKACWSTPILDAQKKVLGSFAIYQRQTGLPDNWQRELIEFATHTAAICITRHRAETTLNHERSQATAVLNSLSAHIAVIDEQGVVLAVNEAWRKFARENRALSSATVEPGSPYLAIVERAALAGETTAQAALAGIRQVLSGEKAQFELEYPCDSPTETRRFLMLVTALQGGRGAVLAHENITKRTQAEAAMRDAAMFNRQIIAGAKEGIVVLDRKLRYLVWNPYMEELLGLPADQVLGRHPLEVFPWVKDGGQLAAMERALRGETVILPDNQRLRTGAKRISWIHARLAPFRDGRGEIVGVIATISDVTARKQSEEQLRALAGRLQSVREEQSAHLAREIHDVLGQQLTALKLDLAWIKRRATTIADPTLSTSLTQKLTDSSALVDDTIRTVQKVATELRPGLLDKLGLTAALEHEAKQFAARAGLQHGLKLEKAPADLELKRSIEVFRIYQEILTNIARHAQATRFEVELDTDSSSLQLKVSDNGRGISEQQLSGTRSLGLLGMQERAQLLGGTLDIRGSAGKGTVVVLTLPIANPT